MLCVAGAFQKRTFSMQLGIQQSSAPVQFHSVHSQTRGSHEYNNSDHHLTLSFTLLSHLQTNDTIDPPRQKKTMWTVQESTSLHARFKSGCQKYRPMAFFSKHPSVYRAFSPSRLKIPDISRANINLGDKRI